jgi:hypothetical protein
MEVRKSMPLCPVVRTSDGSTTDGQYQRELDRSVLPNEIAAKLPATGEYIVTVCAAAAISGEEKKI